MEKIHAANLISSYIFPSIFLKDSVINEYHREKIASIPAPIHVVYSPGRQDVVVV